MMRRGVLVPLPPVLLPFGLLSFGLLGCGLLGCGPADRPPRSVRVELPRGLERPKGLKPDPKPVAAPAPGTGLVRPVPPGPGDPSVAGVCRFDETVAECWNVEGTRDKRLTGAVRQLLRNRHDSVPTAFGRRNRIVVADLPNPSGDVSYRLTAHASSGDGETTISGVNGRYLVFVAEDARVRTTAIRFVQARRLSQTASLAVQKGATAKLAGCTLSVDSVTKLDPRDPMAFLIRGGPGWKVVVRRTGGGPHPPAFVPVDLYPGLMADGRRMRFVGKAGKVEYAPANAPRIIPYGDTGLPKDVFAVIVDRDPARSAPLTVGADQERTITRGDIPLDPK